MGRSGVYVVSGVADTFGPIALLAELLDGKASAVWIVLGLCLVWGGSLAIDWLLVRWLRRVVLGRAGHTSPLSATLVLVAATFEAPARSLRLAQCSGLGAASLVATSPVQ